MEQQMELNSKNTVFALDIGTRSIIGMVGCVENGKVNILAIEKAEHTKRAMLDGQIEDIAQVAKIAGDVKNRLETKLGMTFDRVSVAAAGRALKTERASFELELDDIQVITDETISRLEAGAINAAEEAFESSDNSEQRRFYLVGYNVCQYYLDNYMMSSLKDHRGKNIKVDIIATFLPGEVVDSLYMAMSKIGLDIASMTLEPIAAINAAIPENLRLLNLVLVDIGAGTSDIAICREGSVIGYTMATVAGDEITETIMKKYLVDFETAEQIKFQLDENEELHFTDILGFEQSIPKDDIMDCINENIASLCDEIGKRIVEVNGGAPSALFLAGGGSKLNGLKDIITKSLEMDPKRVATAGNNFRMSAYSDSYDLNDPEYTTPLGIVVSSGLNLTNDGFRVLLNGKSAKLFRSGTFTVLNLLMMNGYSYQDIMGRSGQSISVIINGRRRIFYGSKSEPAVLTVNGNDGKLSDIVRAGDNIVFIPAVNGRDADVRLTDIEGVVPGMDVVVNGEIVLPSTKLENGDNVTFEPLSEEYSNMLKNYGLNDEETDSGRDDGNEHKSTAQKEEDAFEKQQGDEKQQRIEKQISTGEAEVAKPAAETVQFVVNNVQIVLEKKKNNDPYYLMDMLQHSGLNLEGLKNPVVIKVNGEERPFGHELKFGDRVEIYEKK
ncbi:MAG: pilus assembly protein PilM [Firmicutes bacterium]|nr:pilus assembly protein PilM [Bacillota bacterium]